MHRHCTFSLYYVQCCCMELYISLYVYMMHSMLYADMYSASVVYSVFFVGFSTTLLVLCLGVLCLQFSIGCSCYITAWSYIVLPCYILYFQGSCSAGSVVCKWFGLLCTTYRGKEEG